MVAAQALSAARAAAEDLAPSPSISSRLCVQLASALHGYVSEVMLATPAQETDDRNALKASNRPMDSMQRLDFITGLSSLGYGCPMHAALPAAVHGHVSQHSSWRFA